MAIETFKIICVTVLLGPGYACTVEDLPLKECDCHPFVTGFIFII